MLKNNPPLSFQPLNTHDESDTSEFSSHITLDDPMPPKRYRKNISFFKFITFSESWSLIKKINNAKHQLGPDDIPPIFEFYNIEKKIRILEEKWLDELSHKEPSIVKATFKAFQKEFLIIFILCFLTITIKLVSLQLMSNMIGQVTLTNFGSDIELSSMLFSASLLTVAVIILAPVDSWFWHLCHVFGAIIKNTIIAFAYKKLQNVALSSVQQVNIGKVINLLSSDINEVAQGIPHIMPGLFSLYTILLSGVMMWQYFGATTLWGMLALTGFMILSNYLSGQTESIRTERTSLTDSRIKLTNELFESIRLIKMYAWETPFKNTIEDLREKEVLKLIKQQMISVLGQCIAATSCESALTMMCIAYTLTGGMLSPEKIYPCLMMLRFVGGWGPSVFHDATIAASAVKVLKTRLESVLLIQSIDDLNNDFFQSQSALPFVDFSNFSAWWRKEDQKPCLDDINLKLHSGQLLTIVGSIGSGKTSFLLSFLREIPRTQGDLTINGKVAYVEQEPMIFSDTVRANILFGKEYDGDLYKAVISACSLNQDIEELCNGDSTLVGERGITLSGGQKARLSLARALYSQSDIYLLDDPLSAVDSRVGRHIFDHAIKGDLLKDKIVVLVTHHLHYAKESDRILLFSDGKIVSEGTYEDVKRTGDDLFKKFSENEKQTEADDSNQQQLSLDSHHEEFNKDDKQNQEAIPGEETYYQVSFSTYKKYIKENGDYLFFLAVVLSYLCFECITIGFSRLMGAWGTAHVVHQSQNNDFKFDNTPYALGSLSLVIMAIISSFTKSVLFTRFVLKTNSNIHTRVLQKLINAKTRFFDQTPIGTILNRFSNNLGTLDITNAQMMPGVLEGLSHVGLRILVIILINPFFILPMIIVTVLSYKIRTIMAKPLLETERINLATQSPIYSEISSTINGLLAIRVFKQGHNFFKKFVGFIYTNVKTHLAQERIFMFFTLLMKATLDTMFILGNFICIFIAYFTTFDAALFGLALQLLQEIAEDGNWLTRLSLLVDIHMQSVERILIYYDIKNENKHENIINRGPWLRHGSISFNNVYMKYDSDLEFVLRGLNFQITAGSKVGIVGRTGAGKSSIIQALFRMTEIESMPGSSIELDGVDISKLDLTELRQNLSIIPQTPVVFTGTIRRNLDPFNQFSDSELWQALQEVSLMDYVESLENKLETDMTIGNSIFSSGQKQLICLARAILKKSKIIILDEATANVDLKTDDFIQNKIMERFEDCTVITIAHRLLTIANYDKVLVMDKGKVVEYDSPYLLMVENQGDENITKQNGLFAEMVKSSKGTSAQQIFEISKNKFYNISLDNN